MRRRAVTVDWERPTLRLYAVGDAHVGAEACDEKKIERLARIIADDPDALVVGLGDYIEAIAPDDRRFDPSELAPFLAGAKENLNNLYWCQAARFAKLMEPTAGRWAMLIAGNHETKAAMRYHTDAAALIAGWMACPYQGGTDEAGWLRVRLLDEGGKNRGMVDVYCQHGWGGGELRGSDALKLERLCYRKCADVVLMAHVHRAHAMPVTAEALDRAGWEARVDRWGVISYPLIGKHGYIARHGGNAPPTGYAVIEIQRHGREVPLIGAKLQAL